MIEIIKSLLGLGPKPDYAELVKAGALVLDVRSKSEFASGHIKGSLNIPVDELSASLDRLRDKNRPVITCCASGIRSAAAKRILTGKGFTSVYNGGGWQGLNRKIG